MSIVGDHNTDDLARSQTLIGGFLALPVISSVAVRLLVRPFLDRIAAAFMILVIAGIATYGLLRPDYNWDMVAYVAAALEDRVEDPETLHALTWAEITPGARPEQLYHLQQSNPYNLHQWENPVDFQSQLSMYRVKVGYLALIRGLEPVFGLAQASILLSVLPSAGLGLLCFYWLKRRDALQAAFIAMPLLVLADYTHMTTAVTPDMLLGMISIAAIILLLIGSVYSACALLIVSVLIRPDNIILIFALLIAAGLFRWRFLPMLATFIASLAICIYEQKTGGHPGWWAHFYFSCVKIQNSMIGFQPDFSLVELVRGYVRGVMVALTDNDWPGLLLILSAGWALLAKAGRMSTRGNMIAFALVIGTLGKFVSFPLPDDRFYFVFIAGLIVVLAAEWRPDFSLQRRTVRTAQVSPDR